MKQFHRQPALPGKLGIEIQGFLDIVGYLTVANDNEGNTIRRLYIQPGALYQAKHRFAGMNIKSIDAPSMQRLVDLSDQAAQVAVVTTPVEKKG